MAEATVDSGSPATEWRPDMRAVLLSRVLMFAVLYWAGDAFPQGSAPRGAVIAYGLSTALFLTTALMPRFRIAPPSRFLLFFQFLVELFTESVVLIAGGGYDSTHGFLFLLTILSGGVFFGYAGALALAALSAAIFGAVGLLHLGLLPFPDRAGLSQLSPDAVEMRFSLTVALFFLVALLSSDGARRLARARRELAGATEALRLARFSAESMMQDLPTGILFFDREYRLRYRNAPAGQILGKDLPDGLGLEEAWSGVLEKETLDRWVRDQGGSSYAEMEAEAGKRPIRVLYKPLVRAEETLGFIFTVFDLTEEKRVERLLMRQERMAALGQMSARIAHEIRNPLAGVSGAAQMLRDSPLSGPEEQKLLRLIVGESNRLNRFLGDLLDYVRDKPPVLRKVSLRPLFRRAVALLEKAPAFRSGLVSIREKEENTDVEIVTDQDLLLQVLLNAGLNALEAMDQGGGDLTFSLARSGDDLRIEVADTGPGMDAATLARAFDPFFTTKPQGTGLGLAVCVQAMQALEGNINLTSAPGQGTIVSLSLPLEPKRIGATHGNQG